MVTDPRWPLKVNIQTADRRKQDGTIWFRVRHLICGVGRGGHGTAGDNNGCHPESAGALANRYRKDVDCTSARGCYRFKSKTSAKSIHFERRRNHRTKEVGSFGCTVEAFDGPGLKLWK